MYQAASLQMEWCLECHREPEKFLRPREKVFDMEWEPSRNQIAEGRKLMAFSVAPMPPNGPPPKPERGTRCAALSTGAGAGRRSLTPPTPPPAATRRSRHRSGRS